MSRRLSRDERARARFILRRWRRLLLLQLDVEEGGNPRTVHQLMARGVLHVQKGRYMMVPDAAPPKACARIAARYPALMPVGGGAVQTH